MRYFVAAGLFCGALLLIPATAGALDGDPAKGQPIATGVCAACHGPDGNSLLPANPSLAGQHPEYLYKQLRDYKSGARKNAIMTARAAGLSDEDMRNLVAYFAAQKPRPGVAYDAALATFGQRIYRAGNAGTGVVACAGCHSPDGVGIPVLFPRLKGQHRDYTLTQLKAFSAGDRGNDPSSMMRTIAGRMSDQEMQAVAEYIAGLN
jgi:cytochrome c553